MTNELWWDDEDAAHIRHRSTRYPGATDIEPAWAIEAATTRIGLFVTLIRKVE
jgi:hypothetical protein